MNNIHFIELEAHYSWISDVKLFNQTILISCSAETNIKLWNMKTFECIHILSGHDDFVYNIEIEFNGNLLSCSSDRTVKYL